MGGKAFNHGAEPLITPRMPLEIYTLIQKQVRSLLSHYFHHVGTPIEAPGKTSYGDVDFLVADPKSALPEPRIEYLAKILGATKWISAHSVMNFALPYPRIDHEGDNHVSSSKEHEKGVRTEVEEEIGEKLPPKKRKLSDNEENPEKFVQVDIHICKTLSDFDWELFHQAHGDLWNILGSMIRSQGITINDTGLYLRIPDLETVDRKKSMIHLSSDPDRVLEFLGLEKEKWWEGFRSIEQMFEYATTCRFFYVRVDDQLEVGKDMDDRAVKEDKNLLKSNDRKRMKQRPVFKQWIEEYIPKLRQEGSSPAEPISRERMTELALETFGDKPKADYCSRLTAWKREQQRDEIFGVIKKAVPMPVVDGVENVKATQAWQHRSGTIKALKAIILDGSTEEGVDLEDGIVDGDGFYDSDKVRSFTERKWKEVGDIKWLKMQKEAAEGMTKKKAKAKAEGEGAA